MNIFDQKTWIEIDLLIKNLFYNKKYKNFTVKSFFK